MMPLFAPVFARLFATLPAGHFRSSSGLRPTLRDGTDPLLGGHGGGPGGCHRLQLWTGGAL